MLKRDVRATFFVATDFIDNQQLNWVQKKGVCVDAARRRSGDAIADTLRILNQTHRLNLQSRRELVEWLCRIDQRRLDELNHATDLLQIDVDEYLRVYRPYLSADQIRQLASEGFVIGAHSRKHHIIGELADRNEMADEIVESCRIIRDLTGRKQVPFAFPFHGRNVDREWLAALRREHDFIGLFYDTDMFKRDTADVINRVPADWPKGSVPGKSNLPFLLSRAYQG
jgi:peptidoglycan/xylan/chitin deacetylase (PgdA/CDA1 family)